jgi:hypothetical protein
MKQLFSPIAGTSPFIYLFSLDVLRVAAGPLASGAHHLPSTPHCSVCSHVLARVDAVSPCSRVPQRSALCSFLLHVDDSCRFSQSLWRFLRIQCVTSSRQNKSWWCFGTLSWTRQNNQNGRTECATLHAKILREVPTSVNSDFTQTPSPKEEFE